MIRSIVSLAIFFAVGFYSNLFAQSKIDSSLWERFQVEDTVDCFLVFHRQAPAFHLDDNLSKSQKADFVFTTLSQIALKTQAPIIDSLVLWNIEYKSFYIVNALRIQADSNHLSILAQDTSISSILPDFTSGISRLPRNQLNIRSDHKYLNWAIQQIQADSVWQMGITGKNAVIGGQDTGYEWEHYLLQNKYRGNRSDSTIDHNYHWHDAIQGPNSLLQDSLYSDSLNPCGFNSSYPCDDGGHGTHTMGIALGSGKGDSTGIAPGAQWIGARVMDRSYGQLSSYLSGLQWFLAPTDLTGHNPRPHLAPDVIINSWTCPEKEGCNSKNIALLDSAFARLTASGVFVVASAGNDGRNGCGSLSNYPAVFKNSFTVGASDMNDSITSFSNRGLESDPNIKPELVAPGLGIQSAYLHNSLKSLSGTSMSGPIVAGVVALVLEANPSLAGQVDKIREILLTSSLPIFGNPCGISKSPNPVYGYGRINALKAVEIAREITTEVKAITTKNDIVIYPNPMTDGFHTTLMEGPSTIQIIDIQGRVLRQENINNSKNTFINTDFLKNGMYFVRIHHNHQWTTHKIIKI